MGPDKKALMRTPIMLADVLRFVVDLSVHGCAVLVAGIAFVTLWRQDSVLLQVLAFPAAFAAMIVGFWLSIGVLCLACLRRITPGAYRLTDPGALRWIVSDSLVRMIQRSFLRGYIDDFAPIRYCFYRLLGARIDRTFFIGWNTRILDPWGLDVGRNVIIGSFAVITAHSVEGECVVLAPVRIHDGATIGVNSTILPGVEVGKGAIIGAASLVKKNCKIPPGEIWAGVPARKIGEVADRVPPPAAVPETTARE